MMRLLGLSVVVVLSACSSPPAAPAENPAAKACTMLAAAENRVNDAGWAFVQAGKPSSGSPAGLAALAAYPAAIGDALDAAPADLAPYFSELKRLTLDYQVSKVNDTGVAAELTADDLVERCEAAGVDMPITNMQTGVVE